MNSKSVKFITALLVFLILIIVNVFLTSGVFALENSFITIVNPVRGSDFWETTNQQPIEAILSQSNIINKERLSATWLIRPDAFEDKGVVDFLNSLPRDKNELGIFFEITPTLINQTKVIYPNGEKNDAHRYFLSGYSLCEREIIINKSFDLFKEKFGFYPRSVGAWRIDAYSLSYMRKKFGVVAVLLLADQFSTDRYQVWGSWWGVPYYPSKFNTIIPAQSLRNKLDIVVLQWAARDPVNGYGSSVRESTFSVQANDYLAHKLDISYFEKLLRIYTEPGKNKFGHLVVGLE